MAKDKERSVNPAAAQRKAEKQKAIKKNKSSTQALRNEKLARRNPERLQTQINDLKALATSGDIKPREKAILEELEKDLRAIKKARDALGDKAPIFSSGNYRREGDGSILGKRRHDGQRKEYQEPESFCSSTDEDVRRIPMPEDTPPPIPREYRRNPQGTNANNEPLGSDRHSLPEKPAAPVQTTYSSAPQIRDLKQEAVKRFVPNIVRQKQAAVKGVGGLVEPEELDRLEAEGYGVRKPDSVAAAKDTAAAQDEDEDESDGEVRRLAEEEERFRREMAMEMEGVEATAAEPEGLDTMITAKRTHQPLVEDVSDEDI
jgi:WW domain binding protein 11